MAHEFRWGGLDGHIFEKIISLDNLFAAWREFQRGKRSKPDVQNFAFDLENNLFALHNTLVQRAYRPEKYAFFFVRDPKLRPIHKASVRDRVLFQAVFRVLYPIFDPAFIYDSYACRFSKGTHRGVERLELFLRKQSKNYRHQTFALKCDIRQFFYSVDHAVLLTLLRQKINEPAVIDLLRKILDSFHVRPGKGLPLGNVTSQLFANIYLNELDQFVKHVLKEKYYVRYCDDFVIVSSDHDHLVALIHRLSDFLHEHLQLLLHPRKVEIKKVSQGVDFLGYIIRKRHRVLRTRTKQRIFKELRQKANQYVRGELSKESLMQSLHSYLGMTQHCNSYKVNQNIHAIIKLDF